MRGFSVNIVDFWMSSKALVEVFKTTFFPEQIDCEWLCLGLITNHSEYYE